MSKVLIQTKNMPVSVLKSEWIYIFIHFKNRMSLSVPCCRFPPECSLPAPTSRTELWWPYTVLSGCCWEDITGLTPLNESLFFKDINKVFKSFHFSCRYALRRRTPSCPTLLTSWPCIKQTPTHETTSHGSTWCADIFTKPFRTSPSAWSRIWQRFVQLCY